MAFAQFPSSLVLPVIEEALIILEDYIEKHPKEYGIQEILNMTDELECMAELSSITSHVFLSGDEVGIFTFALNRMYGPGFVEGSDKKIKELIEGLKLPKMWA